MISFVDTLLVEEKQQSPNGEKQSDTAGKTLTLLCCDNDHLSVYVAMCLHVPTLMYQMNMCL